MAHPVYLDYNGTTPHAPEVIEAMRPFIETQFGNPSSTHWYGIRPRKAVEEARKQVAALLNCRSHEVFFTSGGTESNNHAIKGMANALGNKGRHIITTAIEHPAVLEVCRHLEIRGFETTCVGVDQAGKVNVDDICNAIRKDTILISVMHANNEVGTIQPIPEISALARKHGIAMHTDAAQSMGKIPTDVQVLGVDLLSIAGHKLYAPKGIGALFVRQGVFPEKFCHGASQERGYRAGTENVPWMVGLGRACELAAQNPGHTANHMKSMRDRLHKGLADQLDDVRLNGHPDDRLPNTLSLSFKGVEANRILEEIGLEVAASPGAACHSDTVSLSHVLEAMKIPLEWAKGTIRLSTGKMTTPEEIDRAVEAIVRAVTHLRGTSGV